jgi:hypothetical protein
MNGISGQNTTTPRRRPWYVPNLTIRILIALVIAWLVVMVFFGTSAISH